MVMKVNKESVLHQNEQTLKVADGTVTGYMQCRGIASLTEMHHVEAKPKYGWKLRSVSHFFWHYL